MEDLAEKAMGEGGALLIHLIDEKYARIIGVNLKLDGLALEHVVYGTFIKNIYNPAIGKGLLEVSSNSEYWKDFTIEQLTKRLAEVLEMGESGVVEFLPRLLGMNFTWEDRNGRYKFCFEPHSWNEGEYTLKIEKVRKLDSPKIIRRKHRRLYF